MVGHGVVRTWGEYITEVTSDDRAEREDVPRQRLDRLILGFLLHPVSSVAP